MFQCKDVAEEASNYLNKDLPVSKRIGLFLHLVICSCCRNYLQQIRQTIQTVSVMQPKEHVETDMSELVEKLRGVRKSD